MAKILYHSTYGSDDPTRGTLVFVAANGAAEAGHTPTIGLSGEAAYLMKDAVAEATVGVGWGSAKDFIAKAVENDIPIFV